MRAEAGEADQLLPPIHGWKFVSKKYDQMDYYEEICDWSSGPQKCVSYDEWYEWSSEDQVLECSRQPSTACKEIRIEFRGWTTWLTAWWKGFNKCAGRYLPVEGDYIKGRQVFLPSIIISTSNWIAQRPVVISGLIWISWMVDRSQKSNKLHTKIISLLLYCCCAIVPLKYFF